MLPHRPSRWLLMLAACALFAPAPSFAQTPPGGTPAPSPAATTNTATVSPASKTSPPPPVTSPPPVKLNVIVTDKENRAVDDARREDFLVVEDGAAQLVTHFSLDAMPVSYGLVIDNSGSMRSQLREVLLTSMNIIQTNQPGDETFILRFVSHDLVERVQDFTADKDVLVQALRRLHIQKGQTALTDAIYSSAQYLMTSGRRDGGDRRRRALVLITDGEDRQSLRKPEELFALLRDADLQIFVVGLVNELELEGGFIRKSPRERSTDFLKRLARETGGRAFFPKKVTELEAIIREITHDLRNQYVVGYTPSDNPKRKPYRKIEIKLASAPGRERRIAITRPGRNANEK